MKNSTKVKNKNNLLDFSSFTQKVNTTNFQLNYLETKLNSLYTKINTLNNTLYLRGQQMYSDYEKRLKNSISEYTDIEKTYKVKQTDVKKLSTGLFKNVEDVVKAAYRISTNMNISPKLKTNFLHLNNTMNFHTKSAIVFINSVKNYAKTNDRDEFKLNCQNSNSKDFSLNIVYGAYALQVPFKIIANQEYDFTPVTTTENITKEINLKTTVKVDGSRNKDDSNSDPKLYYNLSSEFILSTLIRMGFSFSTFLFFFSGNHKFDIFQNTRYSESHSYWRTEIDTCHRHRCRSRHCHFKDVKYWTSEATIFSESKDHLIQENSFSGILPYMLQQDENIL